MLRLHYDFICSAAVILNKRALKAPARLQHHVKEMSVNVLQRGARAGKREDLMKSYTSKKKANKNRHFHSIYQKVLG